MGCSSSTLSPQPRNRYDVAKLNETAATNAQVREYTKDSALMLKFNDIAGILQDSIRTTPVERIRGCSKHRLAEQMQQRQLVLQAINEDPRLLELLLAAQGVNPGLPEEFHGSLDSNTGAVATIHMLKLGERQSAQLQSLKIQSDGYRRECSEQIRLNGELKSENVKYEQQNADHQKLNSHLQSEVSKLTALNESWSSRNQEHERLNGEMTEINISLRTQVNDLSEQSESYRKQVVELEARVEDFTAKLQDLRRVQNQLEVLAQECNGSVGQVRSVLERLERNLKLDTVNTVLLFFDRVDRSRQGRLSSQEVPMFVDNISFLWKYVSGWNKEEMKASWISQGGVTLEQITELVNTMLEKPSVPAEERTEDASVSSARKTAIAEESLPAAEKPVKAEREVLPPRATPLVDSGDAAAGIASRPPRVCGNKLTISPSSLLDDGAMSDSTCSRRSSKKTSVDHLGLASPTRPSTRSPQVSTVCLRHDLAPSLTETAFKPDDSLKQALHLAVTAA